MKEKERDMQAMSLQYMALHNDLKVFRIPDEVYLVVRMASLGKPVSRGLAIKASKALSGWPDELVIRQPHGSRYPVVLIRENKVPGGRFTPGQEELIAEMQDKDILMFVTVGLDANLELTKEFLAWQPTG